MRKEYKICIFVFLIISLAVFSYIRFLENKFEEIELVCQTENTLYVPDETYIDFDKVLKEIASQEYDIETHNCVHFSKELKRKLEEIGIKSEIIYGEQDGKGHAWIGVFIEPQRARFISPDEDYIWGMEYID